MTPDQSSETERLREMLAEDTGSEAESLLATVEALKRWPAPEPTSESTAQLIALLSAELPRKENRWYQLAEWWPWLLVRAQMRIVRQEIWIASLLVMVLGTLVTLGEYTSNAGTLPFVLIAPLVTAVSVAYLYGPEVDAALEIELSMPISPRLVLLARLALVFGFDLILGIGASVVLATVHAELSLWSLVMTWLAPMAFLSALAFVLSIIWMEPLVGVAVSLGLWTVQTIMRFVAINGLPLRLYLPDMLAADTRPWMLLASVLLCVIGFWFAGREEPWIWSDN